MNEKPVLKNEFIIGRQIVAEKYKYYFFYHIFTFSLFYLRLLKYLVMSALLGYKKGPAWAGNKSKIVTSLPVHDLQI